MSLTTQQIADFQRDGFVHIPNAIAPELVDRALHIINYNLGEGIPVEELPKWRSQSYFPDASGEAGITDLFNASGLLDTMRDLMGHENVAPAKGGQLALRFPRKPGAEVQPPHPHIDGVYSPNNGVKKGTIHSFSALLGVFLTDVDADYAGNFVVWPGSHLKMQEYFREHGTAVVTEEGRNPPIERGEMVQIKAKAGDAVLAHYQLFHGVAGNTAPRPRFATFFRVMHPEHEAHRMECLTDLWREWPGVRAAS